MFKGKDIVGRFIETYHRVSVDKLEEFCLSDDPDKCLGCNQCDGEPYSILLNEYRERFRSMDTLAQLPGTSSNRRKEEDQ